MKLPIEIKQIEKGNFNTDPKMYILESVIAMLVLIIFTLISILITTGVEGLGSIMRTIIEIVTLIAISMTAFFTLKSARAARDSAEASSTDVEILQLGEKRKIKPFLAVLSKELTLRSGQIGEKWDDNGNVLEIVVLNSNLATDILVNVEIKNIKPIFISKLKIN